MIPRNKRKLSKKEEKAKLNKVETFSVENNKTEGEEKKEKKQVAIPEVINVKDLAERSNIPLTQVIGELMKNGILANINESIDFETAAIIGDDLGIEIVKEDADLQNAAVKEQLVISDEKKLKPRPPVVAIMGHVDHGKTTLLDKIRSAHVVESESGGITQHISAYQVVLNQSKKKNLKNRKITFIDTPGHAAFSAMRTHGTAITDIIVLIVAATDGVMPQTKEVIEQAKINNVPIIVAINKTDLPDADVMKTKQQLSDFELIPEDWGGKTVMVEVSAKTGNGIDNLLEMILIQAEMMELKANPDEKAVGVVIESHMHKGAGALALVLIENGTLKVGDPIQIGSSWGKVRILEDYNSQPIISAPPSFPARVAGLKSIPSFGEKMLVFGSEKEAKEAAELYNVSAKKTYHASAKKIGMAQVASEVASGELSELKLIIKSDVFGSLQAIKKSLSEINSQEISIRIISEGIGAISESDITLARATNAIVIGFRVPELMAAKKIAEHEGVTVQLYDIIYKLIDDIKGVLSGMLPPEVVEEETGKGEILAIFRDDKKSFVAGGKIESGKVSNGDEIKIFQDRNEKWRGKILSLRREKSEVREAEAGVECGFGLEPGAKIAVGDEFVTFKTVLNKRTVE